MFRERKGTVLFNLIIILLSVWLINAIPAGAQFSNIPFTPFVPSFRYGGIWNPFFANLGTSFTPLGFNSFGLGLPSFNINPFENVALSNPLDFLINPVTSPLSILNSLSVSGSLPFLQMQMPYGGPTVGPVMPDLLTQTIASLANPLSTRMAAQAGTWTGTWQSNFIAFIILFNSGPMNMTLIENPVLNTLDGTAILVGSRFADTLFNVRGVLTNPTSFVLEGIVATGNALVLNCILTSPTTMTGSYTVSSGFGGQVLDTGVFNLTLV